MNTKRKKTHPELSDDYLESIAEAIVGWVTSEILEEIQRDEGFEDLTVISPVKFIATIIKRVPAVAGLCLQAGAGNYIPYIKTQGEEDASEDGEV